MLKWYCDRCNFRSRKETNIKIHKYSHRYDNLNENLKLYNKFNFNEKINGILYINLKHRKERNNHIKNELKLYNFDPKKIYRIDAIHNKSCGHLGCCQSHIKAIEFAEQKNWENVLIFEDDFIFLKDFEYVSKNLNEIFEEGINWDVFLLSGTNLYKSFSKNKILGKNYKRTVSTATASGYLLNKNYYSKLKDLFKECEKELKKEVILHLEKMKNKKNLPNQWNSTSKNQGLMLQYTETAIDHKWIELQKKDNFLIFDPPLGKQNELFNGNFCGNDT